MPDKISIRERFMAAAHIIWGRELDELTRQERFVTAASVVKQYLSENWIYTNRMYRERQERQVYYFSIEFLLGRLLNTNLMNLGIRDELEAALDELGLNLNEILTEEPDAGLGNGGLGRLAACFIDSMAALGIPGHGCSIRYQYGLFEQRLVQGNQVELPDNWLRDGFVWEYRKPDKAVDVRFGGKAYVVPEGDGRYRAVHEDYLTVMAVPYDVPIVGCGNKTVNTLRLWNAEVNRDFSDYAILTQEQIAAKAKYRDFVENITKYLYPDDSSYEGRRLRLIQEYFFVSAGVQSIVRHFKITGQSVANFAVKNVIHINDTHPALAVPELMRILMDIEGFGWEQAWEITSKSIAYTNHTILPEALERWPVDMFKELLPRIYQIIEEINRRFLFDVRQKYQGDENLVRELSILQDDQVHMARLAVVGSFSVNGVAKIHSDILRYITMQAFSDYFPGRFNNKTNGITHRRWLIAANPALARLLDETIGDGWHKYPLELSRLKKEVGNKEFLIKLHQVKKRQKQLLADYVSRHMGINLDTNMMFDIQVKRIHSYKRQLMNILHIMYRYDQIKNGNKPLVPTVFFFGGKAAPGYHIAKETIRLINAVATRVNHDDAAAGYMKVIFLENFGVSLGELVYPAADVSEQISTASKEASGTGNMKFMMNGAITLGTLDGANVEIKDVVGDDNCVIFGLKAEEVLNFYANGTYSAWDEYNKNPNLKNILNQLKDGTYGDFVSLYDYLLQNNDEFFILKDFDSYRSAHEEIDRRYLDYDKWLSSSAMNIACSGVFSSDRTISEYASDIWKVQSVL